MIIYENPSGDIKTPFLTFLGRLTKLIVCEQDVVCEKLRKIFEYYGVSQLMTPFFTIPIKQLSF